MAIGNMLRERGEQYAANQDELGTWRILDTWHSALKVLEPDEDVPDDSLAVTVVKEGAFLSLMKEAARMGLLDDAGSMGAPECDHEEVADETVDLKAQIVKLQSEKGDLVIKTSRSDTYELKRQALGAVLKLAAMGEMDTLLKD
jgi:hypothetical protein